MDPDVETNRFIFFQKYPAGWLDKNIEFLTNDIIILFEYCTHKCRFAKSSSLCNSLRIFFSYLIGFFERMKAPMPEHVCVCVNILIMIVLWCSFFPLFINVSWLCLLTYICFHCFCVIMTTFYSLTLCFFPLSFQFFITAVTFDISRTQRCDFDSVVCTSN